MNKKEIHFSNNTGFSLCSLGFMIFNFFCILHVFYIINIIMADYTLEAITNKNSISIFLTNLLQTLL